MRRDVEAAEGITPDQAWQGFMVALIDAKLRAWTDRTLIESRDVLDLLLDLRSIVAPVPSV